MLFKIVLFKQQLGAVGISGVLPSRAAVTSRDHKSSLRRSQFAFERHFPFSSQSVQNTSMTKKKEVKSVLTPANLRMFWWWCCEEPSLWENNIHELQERRACGCFQLMRMIGCLGDNSFTSFWLLMMQMLTSDGLKKMITTAKSELDIWNKSAIIILVISWTLLITFFRCINSLSA